MLLTVIITEGIVLPYSLPSVGPGADPNEKMYRQSAALPAGMREGYVFDLATGIVILLGDRGTEV